LAFCSTLVFNYPDGDLEVQLHGAGHYPCLHKGTGDDQVAALSADRDECHIAIGCELVGEGAVVGDCAGAEKAGGLVVLEGEHGLVEGQAVNIP
jgi:hypothetical protein